LNSGEWREFFATQFVIVIHIERCEFEREIMVLLRFEVADRSIAIGIQHFEQHVFFFLGACFISDTWVRRHYRNY
jgi:hypothetical protein